MIKDRNCYFCKYYKDGYCENLELEPCYPQKGCDDFSKQIELKKEINDVLDKIRAEIEEGYGDYDICEWFEDYDYEENDISEYQQVGKVSDILAIIDKYKSDILSIIDKYREGGCVNVSIRK